MLQLHIQKWGNSAGLRLPSGLLMQLGAKVGDALVAEVSGDEVVLRVAKPRHKLADLLAQCNPDAPPPDLDWWDHAKPVGQEVW
jgi:antitoxin component of MazEF toxin-antitoxin module